jgi:arginyl-tRNA synthetase
MSSHLEDAIGARINSAISSAFGNECVEDASPVRQSTRPEFGDFQSNVAMKVAKSVGLAPREVASRLIAALDIDDLCEAPEIAGIGFINLRVRTDVLSREADTLVRGPLFSSGVSEPQRIVVDYSSPNVAKQMHVGHLRSTVIGDALSRVLEAVGHEVIRQNHVGDWGTQFGMLIEQLLDEGKLDDDLDLNQLDSLYRRARVTFETDEDFAGRARRRVIALQSGDDTTMTAWRALVDISLQAFDKAYVRMGIRLTREDVAGESTYNAQLHDVIDGLTARGMITRSDGAACVFVPGFVNRDGAPLPMIVQKADGGFGYDATDLAALRHRVNDLGADRLVYVVDVRQSLHFEQVFAVARAAGWLPDRVRAEHVAFGTILGEDGRPFRTRSGDVVSLSSLLDAAEAAASDLLLERGTAFGPSELATAARAVAIGAVKYADLCNDLGRDYVFALNRMVAMDGNTGPYLQYAHARLVTLLHRGGDTPQVITRLDEQVERRLALLLTGFGSALDSVVDTLQPHRLCSHLYQIATTLSSFYEACPVLKAEGDVRASRLGLCRATQRVLAAGLEMLGIEALERM